MRCELVKGVPAPEQTVPSAPVQKTSKYVLSVLVQTTPEKTSVAEWDIVTEALDKKWHLLGVFDQQFFFDSIELLIDYYSNPDNNAELPTVDATDCLKSGMSRVMPAPAATVEKTRMTKCVKKARWEVKPADVTVLDGSFCHLFILRALYNSLQ